MTFCPVCDNDTLVEGLIYSPEYDDTIEICYDKCDYCGYYDEYECTDYDNYGDYDLEDESEG